jgi:hypothetical protein
MFAKGPQPGATPKADALKRHPGATCRIKHGMCRIIGYVVYAADGTAIASAGTARDAWDRAARTKRRDSADNKEQA